MLITAKQAKRQSETGKEGESSQLEQICSLISLAALRGETQIITDLQSSNAEREWLQLNGYDIYRQTHFQYIRWLIQWKDADT